MTTTAPAQTPTAEQVLTRCRDLTRPALRSAVRSLHAWPARMAAYSLGWCDRDGTPTLDPRAEGKGLRPTLTILAAEAAGARTHTAIPGAVAVELVHVFSLLHDDIMDGDEKRRQRDTAWKTYGTGPAVLAGDALFALAVETLTAAPAAHGTSALRHLSRALRELIHGQSNDLLFETRPWTGPRAVSITEYRTMAEHKTGSLLGCATAIGATLAGAPAHTVTALERFGRHLGVAFQAVDDLLGIWGDPATTGKPVHSDLRQGKKTFPVLAALSTDAPAAHELATLLSSPPDPTTTHRAAALIEEAGGRTATLAEAEHHLTAARHLLHTLPLT
ncbi:polyprenyl synthetase family protein, partial [Streptomyces sp. OF3]